MKSYAVYGFTDFIICLGYKGERIKEYFLNYEAMNNDFTVELGRRESIEFHAGHQEPGWKVTLVDTGYTTATGGRIKRASKFVTGDRFMLTYGDGVSNVDLRQLLDFHLHQRTLATVTGVHPASRFGELLVSGQRVRQFSEKPQTHEGIINGGFFVLERAALDYLNDDPGCVLEREPLERLALQHAAWIVVEVIERGALEREKAAVDDPLVGLRLTSLNCRTRWPLTSNSPKRGQRRSRSRACADEGGSRATAAGPRC